MAYRPSPHGQPRQPLRGGNPPQQQAYRGGQAQQPAQRRGQRAPVDPAAQLRESMSKTGTMNPESGIPLLNEYRCRPGEKHVVEFLTSRYSDKACLKVVVRVLQSACDDLADGAECLVLKPRTGGSVNHTMVKEKEFNTFVVRAFGFTREDDLNTEIADWPEQILSEEPDYLGRVAEVNVYQAFDKKTGGPVYAKREDGSEVEVNNETWFASET